MAKTTKKKNGVSDMFPLTEKEALAFYALCDKMSEKCKELSCDLGYGKVFFQFKKKASVFYKELE